LFVLTQGNFSALSKKSTRKKAKIDPPYYTLNKNFGFVLPEQSVTQKSLKIPKNIQNQSVSNCNSNFMVSMCKTFRFQYVNLCRLRLWTLSSFKIKLTKFVGFLVTWPSFLTCYLKTLGSIPNQLKKLTLFLPDDYKFLRIDPENCVFNL
jgi:hypothetical protein